MSYILLVEDDRPISRLLQVYLEQAGFVITACADGEQALQIFQQQNPILVLLDLMIPRLDGWAVLEEVRRQSSCPVIILTARGAIDDRLSGFERGADDYISKPFDPEEVVARVKAVLRRSPSLVQTDSISLGSLTINFSDGSVSLKGEQLPLARRDWELLAFLMRHPHQVFSRWQLLDNIWGLDYDGGDRAVDVAVKRIRKGLQNWPEEEGEIVTIRGMGYMMRVRNS